ncbi:MAG: PEGA domain-containing protein [Proteobacteria bacterium]|nr:PEGA domain-containing protein [Pseudomonadota bacterium]
MLKTKPDSNKAAESAFMTMILAVVVVLLVPSVVPAYTMKESLDTAVETLVGSGKVHANQRIVISGIVNYHNQKRDQAGTRIETELYFAFADRFPEVKLIDIDESVAGIPSLGTVFVKGSYEPQGGNTILRLQAIKGVLEGEILAQAQVTFETGKTVRRTLVAVLDLEARTLNEEQRRIFSDVFRSVFVKLGAFDMASSADIDKMDPDQIQKATGCSRDSCATVIGEQLGVDRVISSSLRKVRRNFYFLAAKMMDIKDGAIIASATVKHNGSLDTLDAALEQLAGELMGTTAGKPGVAAATSGQTGMVAIKSRPAGADIMLDGRLLADKTEALLQRIPIGKHTINIFKGNLGATRSILVIPGKIEQLDLELKPLQVKLMVDSSPQADVNLDGRNLGKTPLSITASVGSHRVKFSRQGYQDAEQTIEVKPFVQNRISKRLFELPTLTIDSTPTNARVFIFSEYKGVTPFSFKSKIGKLKIRIALDGYQDYQESVDIKLRKKNQLHARLLKLVNLKISVSPPDARVEVDGRRQGGAEPVTFANVHSRRLVELMLPEGLHKITVSHPEAVEKREIPITLTAEMDTHLEEIVLGLKPAYLDRLQYEVVRRRYESVRSKWRWKWRLSLLGSIALAGYSYQQNVLAQTAETDRDDAIQAMLAATSYEVARQYDEKAEEQTEIIKTSNQNEQAGTLISLIFFGLTTWIWLDEPPGPESGEKAGWIRERKRRIHPNPGNSEFTDISLQPFMQLNGKTGVCLSLKW